MLMLAMSWAKPDRKREIERRRETQRERRRGTERGVGGRESGGEIDLEPWRRD